MVLIANGSLARGDFFQQKKLKTVEDGSCRVVERGSCVRCLGVLGRWRYPRRGRWQKNQGREELLLDHFEKDRGKAEGDHRERGRYFECVLKLERRSKLRKNRAFSGKRKRRIAGEKQR